MGQAPDDLVSVIVPAYNASATIAETLASALQQTFANIEVIVIDDGSSDDTVAIVEQFMVKDGRVRLIKQPNGGVARARNAGIAAAEGTYIAPLDADDLWHPTKIEKQLAALVAAGDEYALCYSPYRRIDETSKVIDSSWCEGIEGWVLNRHLFHNFVGNGSSPLMRRDVVVALGGYDPDLRTQGHQGCEDYLLQLLIARSWRYRCVPEYLVGYRFAQHSMSGAFRNMVGSFVLTYRKLLAVVSPRTRGTAEASLCRYLALLARSRLQTGRFSQAFAALGDAMRVSPAKTATALIAAGSDTLRVVARRLQPRGGVGTSRNFYDYTPTEGLRQDTRPRDRRRFERLARLDTGPDL